MPKNILRKIDKEESLSLETLAKVPRLGSMFVLFSRCPLPQGIPGVWPHVALWRRALDQALTDCLYRGAHLKTIEYACETIDWVTGGGEDFREVCWLAGFEPEKVRRAMLWIMDHEEQARSMLEEYKE